MIWFKGRADLEQRKEQEISKGVKVWWLLASIISFSFYYSSIIL